MLALDRRARRGPDPRDTTARAVASILGAVAPNATTSILLLIAGLLPVLGLHAGLDVLPVLVAVAGGVISAWLLLTKTPDYLRPITKATPPLVACASGYFNTVLKVPARSADLLSFADANRRANIPSPAPRGEQKRFIEGAAWVTKRKPRGLVSRLDAVGMGHCAVVNG